MQVEIADLGATALTQRESFIYQQGLRDGIAAMQEAMDEYNTYSEGVTDIAWTSLQDQGLLPLDPNEF